LPADQFVPALMQRLNLAYYEGLLTAAQFHGAAHHRPQEFQVMVAKGRRSIAIGAVRVSFIGRKDISAVPVQSFNTPRGTILISTPEATAVDIVGYFGRIGGLDQTATVLADLAETLDAEKLVEAARTAPIPWAQRLGYLLVRVGAGNHADALKSYVQQHVRQTAALLPAARHDAATRDEEWKLFINADVEPER
jgi:predicted transcriptional regulator of viral defense system